MHPFNCCFSCLALLGQQLAALHLLESPLLDDPGVTFVGDGPAAVGAKHPRYDPESGRVYVNAAQYFEGVAPDVWAFRVGGYQVCEKWLKDRRGRALSPEDVRHYCRTAASLRETIRVQGEIDDVMLGRVCRMKPGQMRAPAVCWDRISAAVSSRAGSGPEF